tara:strand:+ start:220 stop:1350 length:1131 start_codon:yes stop_codon:yes gene_type:complete
VKDDSEHRSEDRPSSDAPDGTQDRDGSERSSNQSQMLFDESPGRFLASRGEGKFEGASGMLFEQAMAQTRMAICLTDPNQHDNPIVFANRAFRELTGYDEDEILGRNCRFLQGRRTDREQVQAMRRAIESEEVTIVELLNYRKDGSAFWNALHLGPIYNDAGDLIYFFGSQWDVTDVKSARAGEQHARVLARELSHRMKNMFAVISGIVTVSGRMHKIEGEAAEINSRIQALGRAYETTLDDAASGSIELGPAIRAILEPYRMAGMAISIDGNGARVPFGSVSVIGLVLHEFAANAEQHGAWSTEGGSVTVDWGIIENGEKARLEWRESGGPRIDEATIEPGVGTAIMDRIVRSAAGKIDRVWNPDGLKAVVEVTI